MNAITRILMNAVRAYNAERLNKLTKLAEVGTEKRGAGVYAEKGNKQFVVFFVIDGVHQWECNYEVSSKIDASNIAQAFADGDVKVGSELDEMQAQHVADLLAPRNDAVAGPAETCDDALESGEVECGQLQGIDRHDDPFYDTSEADDVREHSQDVDVEPPSGEVRACTNEDCGWFGQTDRMCGTTGPLCEDCGDTTELITAEDADIEGGLETLSDFPLEGKKINPSPFKLHPHQQKVVDYINEQAMETLTLGDVSTTRVQIDPVKKPKIERGRSAKRKAAKRKGNQKPRGSNAQPSLLLDKMFGRNPITLAE